MGNRRRRRPGGIRIIRMLVLVLPALGAALLMVPAIALGWIPISIGSAQPLGVATSKGYAESLFLTTASAGEITGTDPMGKGDKGTALVYVQNGEMEDLCLIPRLEIPFINLPINLKITTDSSVNVGEITLAGNGGQIEAIKLPNTVARFGQAPDGVYGVKDGAMVPGLATVLQEAEKKGEEVDESWVERLFPSGPDEDDPPVTFESMNMSTYGLRLDGGILLTSLHIDLGMRELNCTLPGGEGKKGQQQATKGKGGTNGKAKDD